MPDIKELLAKARPRERTIKLLLAGDIAGEIERLEDKLREVSEDWQPADLTEQHPGKAISAQIAKLREQARESEAEFKLRNIGDEAYSSLMAAHPATNENEGFDSVTFPRALIAASCVDPAMTVDDVKALFEVITQGQIKELFDAAWDVHNSSGLVPFSLAGSALLAALGDVK
ncbi:hypothetical protein [Streptomyces sp. ok210]|uniref:hypothetical protein n=1 Tax=Streptomyces sp. ok210 TaxID=1761905 RepID=UPI0008F35419|nr:hypothetical protein [Streptomyces sp. ok210]SFT31812.1 hypothetical protein SAMN04487982_12428 [Streptomyces sp. ok210]